MKTCRRCGDEKNVTEFHRATRNPDGRHRWCKSCVSAHSKIRKATPKYRHGYYKANARKRGLEFDLTLEDFEYFWKQPCVYCGGEIQTIGLDRIDNDVGYTRENSIPCCSICNSMKSGQSLLAFIERCHRIADRLYLDIRTTDASSIARRE